MGRCFSKKKFLKTGIVADLVYSTALFGTYFLVNRFAFSKKEVAA